MASRNGSQALADRIRLGFLQARRLHAKPCGHPIGRFCALRFCFSLRRKVFGVAVGVDRLGRFGASEPVVTPFSLAGFAGSRRPHAPGGRTAIPATFRYAPAVSRRTPVSCSMRRHWPSKSSQGNHLLFFRFAQDVVHIGEGYMAHAEINVPGLILVGRFSSDPHWPVLGDARGDGRSQWRS
jgi:hypothetical protein